MSKSGSVQVYAQFGLGIVVTENPFECRLKFGMALFNWYGWLCWPCLDGCFKFGCFCSLIFFLASKGKGSKLEIKDFLSKSKIIYKYFKNIFVLTKDK